MSFFVLKSVILILGLFCLTESYANPINSIEIADWKKIRNENTLSAYQSYLQKYPKGQYQQIAELRIKELGDNTLPSQQSVATTHIPQQKTSNQSVVICQIKIHGRIVLKEKCRYLPYKGGSFTLTHLNQSKPLLNDWMSMDVKINQQEANIFVSEFSDQSNQYFIGHVMRSQKQKACLENDEIQVCAWK